MKKYLNATFICIDYDAMMHIFNVKYAARFQLIGYQLTKIDDLSHKAILRLYPKKEGKENGRTTKKRNGYCWRKSIV